METPVTGCAQNTLKWHQPRVPPAELNSASDAGAGMGGGVGV